MKRTQTIAVLCLLLLAALIVVIALRSRQPPMLPADRDHARFINPNACMTCHGPGGESPQSRNHTPRTDCMQCHGQP